MKNRKKFLLFLVPAVILIALILIIISAYSKSTPTDDIDSPFIQIEPKDIELHIGDNKELVLTASVPKILEQSQFIWTSSKTEFVTVYETGVITGIGNGSSEITVETTFENKKLTTSCNVKVVELESVELSSNTIVNGAVDLKDDIFDSIIIKSDVGTSSVNLNQVTVRGTIYVEDGTNCKLYLSNSNVNNIEIQNILKRDGENDKLGDIEIPYIILSENSMVNQCILQKGTSISLNDTSEIKILRVSPNADDKISIPLNGFKNDLILDGKINSNVTAVLDNCNIKQVDIEANNQMFTVDLRSKENSESVIEKLHANKYVNLRVGVSTDFIELNSKSFLTATSTNATPALKKTTLDIYNGAIIKKIVNDLDELFVTVEDGTVNDFTANGDKTNITVKSKDVVIDKVTVNGNDAVITGIGSITYVKLNGNNSLVNIIRTKVEADSEAIGNVAGNLLMKPNDSVIITKENIAKSSPGSSPKTNKPVSPNGSASSDSSVESNTSVSSDATTTSDSSMSSDSSVNSDDSVNSDKTTTNYGSASSSGSISWVDAGDPGVSSNTENPVNPIPPTPPTPPHNQLATPSGFTVSVDSSANYTVFWNPVPSALKYSVVVSNKSSGEEKLRKFVDSTDFTINLPDSNVTYQIKVRAIGDGNLLRDSNDGNFEIISDVPLESIVVIQDCKLEDIISKTIQSYDNDKKYKLSLNLNWKTDGSIPNSYSISIENTTSGKTDTVTVPSGVNSFRLNKYITQPSTKYNITVTPDNGNPSSVFSYTSPASACGDNGAGCFVLVKQNCNSNPRN